jgi:alpha-beta hydrolase superfamily lysophospholipase
MAAMSASTTSTMSARDRTSILVRRWRADGEPWAHVLLVHGIHEHSGRYEHVGGWLAATGIEVTSYDQRGYGGSGGRRAWVDRWTDNHDDLEEMLGAVRARSAGLPVVLFGHSLGGLLALGYVVAETPRPLPDAMVLSAPALASTIPAWKQMLAGVLDRVTPTYVLRDAFDGTALSRDPEVGERYRTDPLAFHVTTAHFGAEALREQRRVRAAAPRLAIPTLVYHGEDDRLVPPSASEPLARIRGVERRTWPGLRHESHNEPEGPEVIAAVVAWLRQQFGAAPAAPDAGGSAGATEPPGPFAAGARSPMLDSPHN